MRTVIISFVALHLVKGEALPKENEKTPTESTLLGVGTLHKETKQIKIDKDTIISRNMNLETRRRRTNIGNQPEHNTDPDWSYSAIPKEISQYAEAFKRNMTECLKEVQANDKRSTKQLSPIKESPVHGECLIACVLKRNGVIENGKIRKDNLVSLVGKFYPKETKLMKKLEKNIDRCIDASSHGHNDCEIALQLNECTNDLMSNIKHKPLVNY